MASLDKRLEKAQIRREERLRGLQSPKNIKNLEKKLLQPSHHGPADGSAEKSPKVTGLRTLNVGAHGVSKRAPTTAIGFSIGDRNRLKPKVYRKPSYWDAQGGGFLSGRKPGKTTKALGFNFGQRSQAKLRPAWATKLIEAGFNPMGSMQGLTHDEITAYLEEQGQMYLLTDVEINQLKHFVDLQMQIDGESKTGVIEGGDEVLNLMSRLAATSGDMTQLHSEDQAAILSLIQFSNIVPGFGDMFNEDLIEASIEAPNNFVQYTDNTGVVGFIRKGSYVKAQLIEKMIEEEIMHYEKLHTKFLIAMIVMVIIYLILKAVAVAYALLLSGKADGLPQAVMRLDEINESGINGTSFQL